MNLDELAEQIGEVQLPAMPERKILDEILKYLLLAQKQNVELINATKNLDKLIDTKSEAISKNAANIARNIATIRDDNKTLAAKLDALAKLKRLKNDKLDTLHLMLLGIAALQSLAIIFLIHKF